MLSWPTKKFVNRFSTSDAPLIAEKVARALYNSAKIMERDPNRINEAIKAYAQIGDRFRASPQIYPKEIVARASVDIGVLLGNSEAAVHVYDEIIDVFGASPETDLHEQVKKALLNKGRVLMTIGRPAEAVEAFDAVLAHPGTSRADFALGAMFWKMMILPSLGREHELSELCDKLIASIEPTTELQLREAGARALLAKASILKTGGDRSGEIGTYDTLLSNFGWTLIVASWRLLLRPKN